MKIEARYTDGTYLSQNPDWDRQDSGWKASKILEMLRSHQLEPTSICEVGCGAGDILVHLRREMPRTSMSGFDISPQLARIWEHHEESGVGVQFNLGNFHEVNQQMWDVVLMCDVFEHVRDPFTFLELTREHGRYFIFHVPLDLSVLSLLRGTPLINVRKKVGHLHFYTKDLALATLTDSGYQILRWQYTNASSFAASRSWSAKLAHLVRYVGYGLDKDFGVRLLGGETLLVLARSASAPS
uniref:class I SAM-dependent methyltransferase n=1 Tax=Limnohabitans sp. TaxID=1907725 RepID=UPI00404735D2